MHPVLGVLISTQKKGIVDKIIFTPLPLIWIGVNLSLLMVGYHDIAGLRDWLAVIGYAVAALAIAVFAGRWIFRAVDFYERGAVERIFWLRRIFRYDEAEKLDFRLVRRYVDQYIRKVYVEAKYEMRLVMNDGRKLRLSEHYTGRPLGMRMTVLGRAFEGDEEIDVVRDVIRFAIDNRNNPSAWPSTGDEGRPEMTAEKTRPPQKRYYVNVGTREKGPYTIKRLRAAVKDATLTASAMVRAEDEHENERRPLGDLLQQRPVKK
jgi:hypothetical protein